MKANAAGLKRLFHCPFNWFTIVLQIVFACSTFAFCDEIHEAAGDGDLKKVASLIRENPAVIFSKDTNGATPLHCAVQGNWVNFLAALLAVGPTINTNNMDVVSLLLTNGADVNATWIYGVTPLHVACMHNSADLARLLLANKANVNAKATNGITPLHVATFLNCDAVVELLLAKGADVNARFKNTSKSNGNIFTNMPFAEGAALHLAAMGGLVSMSNKIDLMTNLSNQTIDDRRKRNISVVKLLLANKADINAKDDLGQTPLRVAIISGNNGVVDLLRQHGGHE